MRYKCASCGAELNTATYKGFVAVQPCSKCLLAASKPAQLIKEAIELVMTNQSSGVEG